MGLGFGLGFGSLRPAWLQTELESQPHYELKHTQRDPNQIPIAMS